MYHSIATIAVFTGLSTAHVIRQVPGFGVPIGVPTLPVGAPALPTAPTALPTGALSAIATLVPTGVNTAGGVGGLAPTLPVPTPTLPVSVPGAGVPTLPTPIPAVPGLSLPSQAPDLPVPVPSSASAVQLVNNIQSLTKIVQTIIPAAQQLTLANIGALSTGQGPWATLAKAISTLVAQANANPPSLGSAPGLPQLSGTDATAVTNALTNFESTTGTLVTLLNTQAATFSSVPGVGSALSGISARIASFVQDIAAKVTTLLATDV